MRFFIFIIMGFCNILEISFSVHILRQESYILRQESYILGQKSYILGQKSYILGHLDALIPCGSRSEGTGNRYNRYNSIHKYLWYRISKCSKKNEKSFDSKNMKCFFLRFFSDTSQCFRNHILRML